ncbi:MAG: hypothetical protein GY719_13585, partial [bacterium]|nr:hypothetical protein [bacterium]
PEDPVTSLNLVAMAADAWGGVWQAEDRSGGRLGLPVMAGLRRGWVAGQLTVEPAGDGSRLTYRIDQSEYRVRKSAALTLFVAAIGAAVTIIAPLFPALLRLVPISIVICLMAWFFVLARLRNSGPEEFFEDLAQQARQE